MMSDSNDDENGARLVNSILRWAEEDSNLPEDAKLVVLGALGDEESLMIAFNSARSYPEHREFFHARLHRCASSGCLCEKLRGTERLHRRPLDR
jgi:hypothetical protein